MRGGRHKGHIDTIVLAALVGEPAHGDGLVQRVRERGGEVLDLGEGTVCLALHRLEHRKLIDSTWERPDGRRRRVYAVTKAGRAALGARRADRSLFAPGTQALLEGGGT